MRSRLPFMVLLGALVTTVSGAEAGKPATFPDVGEVIRRFVERAAIARTNRMSGNYVFYRTNITEEFNRKGSLDKKEELLLRVTMDNGDKEVELVEIDGRQPTEEDRERELKRFGGRREGPANRDKPDRSRQLNAFLTREILSRYVFTLVSRESINGRPSLKVSFKPGPDVPDSGKLFERILNHIGGVLWIDETEYELVRADVRLREKVPLWGGLLGGLERLHLTINRTRTTGGRWQDRAVEARFVGRAFMRHIDVKTRDLSSAPRPIPDPPMAAVE